MRLIATFCLPLILLLGSGCASIMVSYPDQTRDFFAAYRDGNLTQAQTRLDRQATGRGPDAVLWRLEQGAVRRAAGRYQLSNEALAQAEALIEAFDARAVVSARDVGSEGAAVLTNLNALPYRGTAYDRIMLNTYRAMNFLALGDFEAARVEFRRAYDRQRQALGRYREALREEEARYNAVDRRIRRAYADVEADYRAYADFVNPFTVWLEGIVFLHTGTDGDDLERARKDFERVLGMIGPLPAVRADYEAAEARLRGESLAPAVYVLLENGVAPGREEWRIDLPLPTEEVVYTAVALPLLDPHPAPVAGVEIAGAGRRTQPLASMDAVVANEFRLLLPGMVLRSLAGAAAKSAAQAAVREEWGEWGQWGIALYQGIVTRADLRHWRTLPKEWQIARIARPEDGRLRLRAAGRERQVVLPEAPAVLVVVKALDHGIVSVAAHGLAPD